MLFAIRFSAVRILPTEEEFGGLHRPGQLGRLDNAVTAMLLRGDLRRYVPIELYENIGMIS